MKQPHTKPKAPASGRTKVSDLLNPSRKSKERFPADAKLSEVLKATESSCNSRPPAKAESANPDPRVMEYAAVLAHAVDIFGSRVRANAWLNRPNRIFNNQSPIQVLTQDPQAVEEELVRIDEGMFY